MDPKVQHRVVLHNYYIKLIEFTRLENKIYKALATCVLNREYVMAHCMSYINGTKYFH